MNSLKLKKHGLVYLKSIIPF